MTAVGMWRSLRSGSGRSSLTEALMRNRTGAEPEQNRRGPALRGHVNAGLPPVRDNLGP